jgi:hypothetical protein
MSIGNLRDQGNQSKNYPWQHNVLKGLQCICDAIEELQTGIDVTIVNPLGQEPMATSIPVVVASDQNGVARTPNFLRPTGANGTVAAGTFSMSFASVGTGNAIVGGIILKPGETLNFDAGAINNTLGAVAYNTTTNAGAELIIITLT